MARKILVLFLIFIVLTGVYFVLENIIKMAIFKESKKLNVKVKFEKFRTNLLTKTVVDNLLVIFPSRDSLVIEKLELNYNLVNLLWDRYKIQRVILVNPYFSLGHFESKVSWNSGRMRLIPLNIKQLKIYNGKVDIRSLAICDSIFFEGTMAMVSNVIKSNVVNMRFLFKQRASNYKITRSKGDIEITASQIKFSNFHLSVPEGDLNFDGEYNLNNKTIKMNFHRGNLTLGPYLKQLHGILSFKGELKLRIDTKRYPSIVAGNINLSTNELRWGEIKFSNFTSELDYQKDSLTIKGTALISDSCYKTGFYFSVYLKDGTFPVGGQLKFLNVPLNQDASYRLWNGEIDFRGRINQGSAYIKLASHDFDSIIGTVGWTKEPQSIILENLIYKSPRGNLKLTGSVDFRGQIPEFRAKILFDKFQAHQILRYNSLFPWRYQRVLDSRSISGVIDGNILISYCQKNFNIQGNLQIVNGKFDVLQLNRAEIKHEINSTQNKVFLDAELYGFNIAPQMWLNNVKLSLRENRLELKIKEFLSHYSLALEGNFSWNEDRILTRIDSLVVSNGNQHFQNITEFYVGQIDSLIFIKNFNLAINNGRLLGEFFKIPYEPLYLNITGYQIKLEELTRFLRLEYQAKGIIDFSLQLRNDQEIVKLPRLKFDLFAEDVSFPINLRPKEFVTLPKVTCGAEITADSILLKQLSFVYQKDTSFISGTIIIPQDELKYGLKLDKLKNLTDWLITLEIQLQDPGSWVFFFIKNLLDVKSGKIYGQGMITGNLNSPGLRGDVSVRDAIVEVRPTGTICYAVESQLHFDGDLIRINNLKGVTVLGDRKVENVFSSGILRLVNFTKVDSLWFKVDFINAPIRPDRDIFAIGSGNIEISSYRLRRDSLGLEFKGEVNVNEALITTEFGSSSEAFAPGPHNMKLDLKINAARDVWLRNSLCDCELKIDLKLFTQENEIIWEGEAQVLQGNFYYLDHVLKLASGKLLFDNIAEFNPLVDISAELFTRPIRIQRDQREPVKIILTLSGRLREPKFTFSSDPPYFSENDILSYLNFNVSWQELSTLEARGLISTLLTNKLIGYFEREVSKKIRDFIYFDYLWIESGILHENGVKISLGKYLSPKLYVNYEYNLRGSFFDAFRVEYYLTKHHTLIGEHNDEGTYLLRYQYNIRY
jgi:hypothetical protein